MASIFHACIAPRAKYHLLIVSEKRKKKWCYSEIGINTTNTNGNRKYIKLTTVNSHASDLFEASAEKLFYYRENLLTVI